jgi:hypothetical protein
MPNDNVIGGDRKVAGHLQLIAPADNHPVKPRYRWFPDLVQSLKGLNKNTHPLIKIIRFLQKILVPLFNISSGTKGAVTGSSQDNDRYTIVPCRILESFPEFCEGLEIKTIVHRRAVDRDGSDPVFLCVENMLEAECSGGTASVFTH